MKIRTGFVSNSSSSSFICNCCGEINSGWDASLRDVGMMQCSNGHTFCDSHQLDVPETNYTVSDIKNYRRNQLKTYTWLTPEEVATRLVEIENDDMSEDNIDDYIREMGTHPSACPICQFQTIASNEAVQYLLKKNGTTLEQLKERIKSEFPSYTEFSKFIK